jgi:hypothetical protein
MLVPTINEARRSHLQLLKKLSQGATIRKFRLVRTRAQLRLYGIIFYQTEYGKSRIQVRLQDGTVWLSQRLLAELYQVSTRTIREHIINIYSDHEQIPEATIRKFRLVQT